MMLFINAIYAANAINEPLSLSFGIFFMPVMPNTFPTICFMMLFINAIYAANAINEPFLFGILFMPVTPISM